MEIRLLNGNEFQMAAQVAGEVFESSVRNQMMEQERVTQFYEYIHPQHLWQETQANRLIIWGAFDNAWMCAVGAMQSDGQITMLYVRPTYWHRHVGWQLVNHMKMFADSVLHLQQLSVHVMPLTAAQFFYRIGFLYLPNANKSLPYVPLVSPVHVQSVEWNQGMRQGAAMTQFAVKPEVTYPVKKMSTRAVITATALVLVISTLIVTGCTLSYFLA